MDLDYLDQLGAFQSRVIAVRMLALRSRFDIPKEFETTAPAGSAVTHHRSEVKAPQYIRHEDRGLRLVLCYGVKNRGFIEATCLTGSPLSDKARREWGCTEGFRFTIIISPPSRDLLNVSPTWSCLEL